MFRLEMLETRALLAGDASALTSSGTYLTNLISDPTNPQITIVGLSGGQLTIDSALLPTSIKDLRISGFESVTVSGPEKIQSLNISRIGSFVGLEVDVGNSLTVTDVANVTLNSIAGFATLTGKETRLEVVDSRSATIYSTLDRLTVSSRNDLMLLSGNPNQEIRLEFQSGGSEILGPRRQTGAEASIPTLPGDLETPPANQQVITPGDLASDPLQTFTGISNGGQSSYTVIVISLSNGADGNLFLLKLQNAVKQGDANGVKNAFAEFVKNVRFVGTSSYGVNLAGNTPTRIEVPGFAEVSRQFEATTRLTTVSPAISISPENLNSNPVSLTVHILGNAEDLPAGATDTHAVTTGTDRPISIEPVLRLEPEQLSPAPASEHLVIDQVRSSLSSLVASVDAHISTVSAYIIDRFGNEFQPGERTVLLVDAKSSRSVAGRETDWVQL